MKDPRKNPETLNHFKKYICVYMLIHSMQEELACQELFSVSVFRIVDHFNGVGESDGCDNELSLSDLAVLADIVRWKSLTHGST